MLRAASKLQSLDEMRFLWTRRTGSPHGVKCSCDWSPMFFIRLDTLSVFYSESWRLPDATRLSDRRFAVVRAKKKLQNEPAGASSDSERAARAGRAQRTTGIAPGPRGGRAEGRPSSTRSLEPAASTRSVRVASRSVARVRWSARRVGRLRFPRRPFSPGWPLQPSLVIFRRDGTLQPRMIFARR